MVHSVHVEYMYLKKVKFHNSRFVQMPTICLCQSRNTSLKDTDCGLLKSSMVWS